MSIVVFQELMRDRHTSQEIDDKHGSDTVATKLIERRDTRRSCTGSYFGHH
jgi:hypothetical protein